MNVVFSDPKMVNCGTLPNEIISRIIGYVDIRHPLCDIISSRIVDHKQELEYRKDNTFNILDIFPDSEINICFSDYCFEKNNLDKRIDKVFRDFDKGIERFHYYNL